MKSISGFLADLALVSAAITATLLLMMLGLYLAGFPAHHVLREWAVSAAGTRADLLISLKNACPLILTGLAAGVAFRSGVFNIGAEGQSILGSLAAVALATRFLPNLPVAAAIPAVLLVAALGGAAWALIAAVLDRLRGVPIVLSTILLNFVASDLLGVLLEGPLKTHATQVVQSDPLPAAYVLPVLLPSIFTAPGGYLHAGFFIAVVVILATWAVQSRTSFGFEILVTGLNPVAAQYAGMPVARRQFAVMLISGAFAGLAGAIQLMGVEGAHSLGSNPVSYGYAGIAVALLGRLHPAGILAAAIFFSLLDHGAAGLEYSGIPLEVSDIVKALIVLIILAATAHVAARRISAREG